MEVTEQYVQSVANATAIKNMLEDSRWEAAVVPIIVSLQKNAAHQGEIWRRRPSFDNMLKAQYFEGQVAFAETLQRMFKLVLQNANVIVAEAQRTLSSAPALGTPEVTQAPAASSLGSDTGKESENDRRE